MKFLIQLIKLKNYKRRENENLSSTISIKKKKKKKNLLLLYNENEKLENDHFEENQQKKKCEMVDEIIYSEILSILSFLSSCQQQENNNKYFVKLSFHIISYQIMIFYQI